jgi:hypothetical protein
VEEAGIRVVLAEPQDVGVDGEVEFVEVGEEIESRFGMAP